MRLEGEFLIVMWAVLAIIIGLVIFGVMKYVKSQNNEADTHGRDSDGPPRT